MFKKALFTFVIAASINVQATSLHPCTPTVQAQPTYINCVQDGKYYSIEINTLMSPASCTGSNRYEVQSAKVVVSKGGRSLATMKIAGDQFTYSIRNKVTFVSKTFSLNLDQCVTPIHGAGFSGSN